MEEIESVRDFLEDVRSKRNRVKKMEESLAENRARVESVTGLKITEKVQTSTQGSIDAMLAALEEEQTRLEEARMELAEMEVTAKSLINRIRYDEIRWTILWERYIVGEPWKSIVPRIRYSRRTVMMLAADGIRMIQEEIRNRGI